MTKVGEKIELVSDAGDSVTCSCADTFWSRLIGLMGKPPPPDGEGLLLRPCNSIHMFFMRFAIDIVFLDKEYRIVKLIRGLAPGKVVGTVKGARQALEVVAGSLPSSFSEGEILHAKFV